jgi:CheY-like chemotaxis protein
LGEDGLVISLTLRAINGPKVLIVEDNADALQLYRRYLSDSPYRMLAATDGARALESAEAERPAAIVLDVMMPSQDGWEILQLLKANPDTRAIPVVICSVLRERELALALGAIEFLVKPVSRDELLLALERLRSVPPGAHRGSPGDSD